MKVKIILRAFHYNTEMPQSPGGGEDKSGWRSFP
jgi:hypothetical protein